MLNKWNQELALHLATELEFICIEFKCHVALTGGCLYKPGWRKDADFLIYRVRQHSVIDTEALFLAFRKLGLYKQSGYGWVHKFYYQPTNVSQDSAGAPLVYATYPVDIFFPEEFKINTPRPTTPEEGLREGEAY